MDRIEGCVGVDGAKSGWIAVWWSSGTLAHHVYSSATDLVETHRAARVIAVDIPIGLSEMGGGWPTARLGLSLVAGGQAVFSLHRYVESLMRLLRWRHHAATGQLMGVASGHNRSRSCRRSDSGTNCYKATQRKESVCVRFTPRCRSPRSMEERAKDWWMQSAPSPARKHASVCWETSLAGKL